MRTSVFVGVSVDGFSARPEGELDFLDAGGGEPHGYDEFIATVDAIVMGAKDLRDTAVSRGGRVEQMSGPPADIVAALSGRGVQHVYVDGGVTIQGFFRAGLVDRLVITRVPVLIGRGIPLFGSLPQDVLLRHVATKAFRGGLAQSEYEVSAA